ncbi:MAG: GDSL-type esterase/lipase family protein [Kiritimatiellia bacterium]
MSEHCQIPRAVEKIMASSHCSVAYIGGSLTVGVGASDVSRTSWRALFKGWLYREYHPRYHCQVSEIMGAIGASESYVTAFTLNRNVMPANPDLALIEFCVNDRGVPDSDLVIKGMEGMTRALLSSRNGCDVIIIGTGDRDRAVDHTLHRRVAEHYDVPFVDMQSYIYDHIGPRGESWDDVSIPFVENDVCHMNDYGNFLCFEALKKCFEEQAELFKDGRRPGRGAPVPEPIVSDELQFTRLVNPARRSKEIVLEGDWRKKPDEFVPWYFDDLMAGAPGAGLTFEFEGTAAAVFGLMYNNGLKLEAELDGKPVSGAYLRHTIEFGKGLVLGHGLPAGRHTVRLTVSRPSKRHNKLENPTAEVAYLGVAGPPG